LGNCQAAFHPIHHKLQPILAAAWVVERLDLGGITSKLAATCCCFFIRKQFDALNINIIILIIDIIINLSSY
jgi:hypothetical protein